jgi:ABC-type glycerol-3-phosphate transport system substrate-binding protein
VVGLHWNKALFREAGLDPERPPQTLAEFDDFAEKLTKRDPKTGALEQIGFLPQEPYWWAWAYPMWFGGHLWDGEQITADIAPNRAAFEWVARQSKKYGVEDINTLTSGFGKFSSPQSGFFAGKLAMVFQGQWLDNFIRQYAPGLEYGAAGFPKTPSGPADFAVVDSDVLVIPRGAKHPREAWEFIKYVNSANPHAEREEDLAGMELLCYLQEKNSPLKEWSPFFAQHHPHPHIDLFRALASSPNAVSFPKIGIWQEYGRELLVVLEEVRKLRRTPEQALQSCQSRLQASFLWHQKSLKRRGPVPGGPAAKSAKP